MPFGDPREVVGQLLQGDRVRRQVDAGVEGRRRVAEGEQHDGVGRVEAEEPRDEREEVGGTGGVDGGRPGLDLCHGPDPARGDGPPAGSCSGAVHDDPAAGAVDGNRPGGRRRASWARALRPDDPPRRPGRVLRGRGAARQAVAARQAGRRRRRRGPRRGRHRVLRGARLRGALGDVDPGGPGPVPARGVPDRALRRLPPDQPPGDGAAARALPAGRAAVARRGLRGPRRRGAGRPVGRGRDGRGRAAQGGRRGGDRRAVRLGRRSPRPSWSPRSPATSTSPTAWSSYLPGPSGTCCAR